MEDSCDFITVMQFAPTWCLLAIIVTDFFISSEMRKVAGVDEGDTFHLRLEIDAQPRMTPMPEEFVSTHKQNEAAQIAFENLTPSRRKEILAYLNSLKRPEPSNKI